MSIFNKLIIFFIRIYQISLSKFLGQNCRFYPSCSRYALECYIRFNFLKATWLMSKRILKCNPFCDGGFDPVPQD